MFGIPSIYAMIAGGVAVLGIIGGFVYEDHMVHHWHQEYLNDEKDKVNLQGVINQIKSTQSIQTSQTEKTVTQVVKVPEVTQKLTKEIDIVPIPPIKGGVCPSEEFPDDVKEAY